MSVSISGPQLLQKEDNSQLGAIIREVLEEEFGYKGDGYASGDASLDDMFGTYSQKGCAYFVVRKDGKLCGGAGFAPLKGGDSKICELQKMYLHREARGSGLGSKLIEACLVAAAEKGYTACYLETTKEMTKAQALYEKFSFQPSIRQGDTGHHGCDVFYMRDLKSLTC
jgi:putative acetyltransferase